jgi:hypothetical protein
MQLLLTKTQGMLLMLLLTMTVVRRMQERLLPRTLTPAHPLECSLGTCHQWQLPRQQQQRAVVVVVSLGVVCCTARVARCSTAPATTTSVQCTVRGTSTSSSSTAQDMPTSSTTLSRKRRQQQQQVTRKQVMAARRLLLTTLGVAAVPTRPTQRQGADGPSMPHLEQQREQAAWRLAPGAAGV